MFEVGDVDVVAQGLSPGEVVRVDHVVVVVEQPVQWGGGGVMPLGHCGAVAGLGDQLLLGQEQVHLERDQRPELVEQVEFAGLS